MRIGVTGACGRMGLAIIKTLYDRGHELEAAFERKESGMVGKPVPVFPRGGDSQVEVVLPNEKQINSCEGIIDFTSPEATMSLLDQASVPVVIGTTGCTEKEIQKIEEISKRIPVLFSPNMSVGVNLLFKLTEMASKALGEDFDTEIIELHHRHKKDAPSGTAKKLLESVRKGGVRKQSREVYGREGMTGERGDEIGVLAMRGGDIVGEHTVYFAAAGERIELIHRATDRNIFARGAVVALEFLVSRPPGLYSMFDVLGL